MKSPGKDLLKSVATSKDAIDLFDKVGEVALDEFLKEGVVKDLPLIGVAVSLVNAGNSLMAYMFVKKIFKFLSETDRMSQSQRDEFYQKLNAKEAQNLGEVTLMILDKCDSHIQSELLGRAFVRLMEGAITKNTYELYAFVIRDLNPYHVQQIQQMYATHDFMAFDPVAATFLSMHGIMEVETRSAITNSQTLKKRYDRTPFGQAFYDHVVKAPVG